MRINYPRKEGQMLKGFINRVIQSAIRKHSNSEIIIGIGRDLIDDTKKLVSIDHKTLNRHVYLLGATGSGKTTLLRNLAYQAVKNGYGVLFVDMKGGSGTSEAIRDIWLGCIESQREEDFVYLSPIEIIPGLKSATWNPLLRGDAATVANKVFDALRSMNQNAKFYEDVKFDVILKLISASKLTNKPFTFKTLANALSSMQSLTEFTNKIPNGTEKKMLYDMIEEWEANPFQFVKNIKGTVVTLQMLSMSYPAKILETHSPTFDLYEAVEKRRVVFCLLPTLLAKESMQQIAKMLLSELKTVAGELLTQCKQTKFVVIVDEFEEMIFPAAKDLFNKAREAGISMIICHQTLADVEYEAGEAYALSLMDNTATKIFMQMKSAKSAELAAKVVGTYQPIPFLQRYIDVKYIVPPEIFMGQNKLYEEGLKVGEAIVKIDAKIYKVIIPLPYRRNRVVLGKDIPFPK